MQMEPTAVKGEDFPLPGTVSLHSVEVRAGTFHEWGDLLCSNTSAPQNLLVGSPCTHHYLPSGPGDVCGPFGDYYYQERTEVLANKCFLRERCCPHLHKSLRQGRHSSASPDWDPSLKGAEVNLKLLYNFRSINIKVSFIHH